MRDHIVVGSSPAGEACAQVGQFDYTARAMAECRAFVGQLRRLFGSEPDGASLRVASFAHDFGRYHEVVCYYDDGNAAAVAYAFRCESESPERWDDESLRVLAAGGFPVYPVED